MKTIKNLERLQQLHLLIEKGNTGTPKEVANKMNISQRLLYNLIDQLKDFEAPICYDRKAKTYFYCEDFQLKVSISVSIISDDEITQIFAGTYFLQDDTIIYSGYDRNYSIIRNIA